MSDYEQRSRNMTEDDLESLISLCDMQTRDGERDDLCVVIAIRLGPNLSKAKFDHAMSQFTGAPTQPTSLQYARYIYLQQEQQRKVASPLELIKSYREGSWCTFKEQHPPASSREGLQHQGRTSTCATE
jgi:hypothetical protein